ncbi:MULTISPECIES: hydrogenase expression/formation protein [Rhodopseudomonas]|uniref:Hydrogenase accessory protein HypB n=1 Tax=Rhodopseudomonas palustris TaxID=1076 RepID=A0A0D7EWJ8_RHOPL|nr:MULTISPECIES: hydrogenase expression/formation protein [Rhodopseudomonas]KIZ45021.1 hydrogenase accessory protein HypB [Rhodopseudomonas palustris]MDF3809542.1 hydrogenase expression/formation C-terminal domain-containing protein [Rhodopseudomonas sp. BAL398]WOK17740.1 hydrogenase expression/formation C-terminal domain-containing protein [Rhodopseudomonas sp. BAL398]
MKQGFWVAPEGAEQPINVFPIGDESLDARHGSLTGAGAIKALASFDGAALAAQCPRAMALLEQLTAALASQRADAPSRAFRLDDFTAMERKLVADVFGEGEVSGVVALPDGSVAQIQESVLAGLWQIRLEGGDAPRDYVEVAAIPELVLRAASDLTAPDLVPGTPPPDAMNVMPVLSEIRDRALAYQPGDPSRVINFTLLPMSPVDMTFLQQTLRNGPIRLVSRGYGTCRVLATGVRNVWSVQFFNAMDMIILDTLEVGGVPTVAIAANEDFEDSAERLAEIREAYFK